MKTLKECALLLGTIVSVVLAADPSITSQASPNNHILLEEQTSSLRRWGGAVLVSSDIPVTIQRYQGDATLPDRGGCEKNPIGEGEAIILVTSNCDTSDTTIIPNITLGEETNQHGHTTVNSINITLDNISSADLASMDFLDPSSYKMERSYTGCTELFCGENPWGTDPPSRTPTDSPTTGPSMSPTPSPTKNPTTSPATGSPTKSPTAGPGSFDSLVANSVNIDTNDNIAASLEERENNDQGKGSVGIIGENEGNDPDGNDMSVESNPEDYIIEENSAFSSQSVAFVLFAIASAHSKVLSDDKLPQKARALDTCTYNAEIFINGCNYDRVFNITAPKARVADANATYTEVITTIDDKMSEFNETVDFAFPKDEMDDLNATFDTVARVERVDGKCNCCGCIGRPYIDASGHKLQAMPLVAADDTCSWLEDNVDRISDCKSKPTENTTKPNEFILGKEWIQSALGEHASVASFSAFSIALMTNGAPSDLVEDALRAGLDEIRHAKISFEIASKLTGGDVIVPGPLPKSTHVFQQDMTKMALAVAREGCIDENLSALVAAAEVDAINTVLETGSGMEKYLNITDSTLIWIRDELHKIALDESNHSALAWRTVKWVCSIDSDACNAVNESVLGKKQLAVAFHRRFDGLDIDSKAMLDLMMAWSKIYTAQDKLNVSTGDGVHEHVCTNSNSDSTSLLTSLVGNIVQSVACN